MGIYYIYTRCFSEEQNKSIYNHANQIAEIKAHYRTKHHENVGIFSDTGSGNTFERPALDRLYKICKKNRLVDKIWISQWSRFGRDNQKALRTIILFMEIGVEINCINNYIDFNHSSWQAILSIHVKSSKFFPIIQEDAEV